MFLKIKQNILSTSINFPKTVIIICLLLSSLIISGVKYIATGWIEFLNTSEPQGASNFPDLSEIKNNSINYESI